MKILYVEDDKDVALTVSERLQENYLVDVAFSANEANSFAQINEYDVIILDVVLPDGSGIELCENFRKNGIKTFILMLTGKGDLNNKVEAFNCGADDYLTKPFHFDELLARIRAYLRRQSDTSNTSSITVNDVTIDTVKRVVTRKNTTIALRRKEYDLLEYFMRNAGKVITREMILDHVWDSAYESFGNTVDVHIKYLRDKIDKSFDKKLIKTIYGMGYKFDA